MNAQNDTQFMTQIYIDGRWVPPVVAKSHDVINPATEAVIGHAPRASAVDVDQAVAAARDAFDHGGVQRRCE